MNSDSQQEQFARPSLPDALDMVIAGRDRDLVGGFKVQRVLPYAQRRMVGPFIFLDQMGPEVLRAGVGLDVAPHPHIGLATVTYLFEGELLHRDSLGTVQMIRPGEVNWMTSGSGIAHSERTPPELRQTGSKLFGLQSWVALPGRDEESEPTFAHHGAGELPIIEGEGKRLRLIAGSLFGAHSPVSTRSQLFYADATLEAGARLQLPAEHEERAVYVVAGSVELTAEDRSFNAGELLVFKPNEALTLRARSDSPARLMLLGGARLDGPRHIWWNFVSSSKDRIEQAKEDWQRGRFALVPDETDFIPLPEPAPVIARNP
jgi:redox-sensitive bicupin YhaK (pirin superfamily)